MLKSKSIFSLLVFLFFAGILSANPKYVASSSGVNLRAGGGTDYNIVEKLSQNTPVTVLSTDGDWLEVEANGKKGYIHQSFLVDDPVKNSKSLARSSSNNSGSSANSNTSSSSSRSVTSQATDYQTAIGLRGGFTSGVSIKHFLNSNMAVEGVVGSRWSGLSLTGMLQWHSPRALDVDGLTWVYGVGARVASYNARTFYRFGSRCNDPNNPRCYTFYDRGESLTAFGIVGIGGLEYKIPDVPITVSLDIVPHFYLNHSGGGFLDGSLSIRYILK
ncbi:MAG: SH3 domain-containing protein [Cyclobacteriaceae bacterium]|nr:SH3 domain-containing protein [Cyclobacteriaceae bacterium]MCH8517224.1 SH3 domain-containing protein [Cyclobacteriaceae bacterium]